MSSRARRPAAAASPCNSSVLGRASGVRTRPRPDELRRGRGRFGTVRMTAQRLPRRDAEGVAVALPHVTAMTRISITFKHERLAYWRTPWLEE